IPIKSLKLAINPHHRFNPVSGLRAGAISIKEDHMRQPSWRRWLGISLLGAGSVLGCRHAEHECDCCLATGRTVYMVPTPQPAMVAASPKPMPTAPVETPKVETTSAKNEALVDTTPVKRLE